MSILARSSGGGVELELALERTDLIPGRLVPGELRIMVGSGLEIRGAFVALVGVEHWKYQVTETDAEGRPRTRVVRREAELPRVPIQLSAATTLGEGISHKLPFEIPVPGLGPPSVAAQVCGATWLLEAKLDVPGFDPSVTLPVTIHQPTALLSAGVVPLAQFALWPSADASEDGLRATVEIEPVPMDLGGPFRARIGLEVPSGLDVQEIRAELRVRAEATVSSGLNEEIEVWSSVISGATRLAAGHREFALEGVVPDVALPSARLPHGRTSATFRLILARSWRRDPNLVRDIALATTREV